MAVKLGRGLIKSMNGKMFSVTRSEDGTYEDGNYIEGFSSIVQVLATMVPLNGSDIKNLPEGARSSDARKLFSADPLLVIDEESKRRADIVLIDGKYFKVDSVKVWPTFWEAIVILLMAPDEPQEGV